MKDDDRIWVGQSAGNMSQSLTGTARLRDQVLSGVAWAVGTRTLGQLANWGMTLVVMRFLEPSDYGLMALVVAITGFLQAMTSMGFADALVQARGLDEDTVQKTFGLVLGLNVALASVLCLAAYPLAAFYHEPRLVPLLQVAGTSFVIIAPSSISRAQLDRQLAFKDTSRIDAASNALAGVTVIALAWAGCGVWSLMIGMLVGLGARSLSLWVLAPFRKGPIFALAGIGHIVRFGSYRTAEHVLWYISSQIDVLLVGKLLGEHALGLYAVSRTIAGTTVDKFGAVVKPIGSAAFARLQDDRTQAVTYLLKTMRLLAFLCFPFFFGMSAIASELVTVVLGPRWSEVILPLSILSFGMALRPVGVILPSFLMALGEVRACFLNALTFFVVFGLAYVSGSPFGISGICTAGAIAYPVQFLFLVRRVAGVTGEPLRRFLFPLFRPLLCAIGMMGAVSASRQAIAGLLSPVATLGVLMAVGVTVYAAASLVLCRPIIRDSFLSFRDIWGERPRISHVAA
jgi:O-antigen/teichoic acid export membrane protein